MHLNAKKPIFVPPQFWGEIEKLSKAALMDMVWDLAIRTSGADVTSESVIMDEIRGTAAIITNYRKQAP